MKKYTSDNSKLKISKIDYSKKLDKLDKAIFAEIEELLKVAPDEGWNEENDGWDTVCLTGYEDSGIEGIKKDGTLDAFTIAGDFNKRYDHTTVTIEDRIYILNEMRRLTAYAVLDGRV